ncbi:beta-glucanase [Vitiosangium sp. GDMCC 1.1324]|nr:beta-glucanase [Vitiosangium sp. GDMCC 1.1324]
MRGSQSVGVRGALAAQCMVVALALLFTMDARAATSGYTITSASSIRFYVNDAPWADLHYQINGGTQLNYRMAVSGTNNTYDVTGVPSGATVRYFFTIGNSSGGATDTAWAQFTMTGSGGGGGTGTWAVVWEDTFSGTGQPNAANWNYHVGNGFNQGSFVGWGNGEWEWYRPENAYQQNGNLVIRADYTTSPLVVGGRNWYQRSARITTKGKKSWTFGRIEARIAMPNAIGTWPAFWMMGTACDDGYTSNYAAPQSYYDVMATNWSSCGEIDIMEHKNSDTNTYQNLFWDSRTGLFPWGDGLNNQQPSNIYVGNVTQFHLYTIEWEPTQIRWYVDRDTNPSPVHTVDITAANKEEFQKPFYVILNLALSGQFTGNAQPNQADFPLYMYVDYVRVWQKQ